MPRQTLLDQVTDLGVWCQEAEEASIGHD